jgi:hypothetical protein
MNKRIKQLAEQAGITTNLDTDYFEKDINKWVDYYSEKFAELIVWEAIGLCKVDVDALTGPFLPEYEKGIVEGYRRANENLRFYFGVQE